MVESRNSNGPNRTKIQMKTIKQLKAWADQWTPSQLVFLAVMAAILLTCAGYVAVKHWEMSRIADFWRQQYEQR